MTYHYLFQWYPVHELSFIVFFLLPVIILAFLYISMVKAIRKARRGSLRKSTHRGGKAGKPPKDNRKQIIRMLGKYFLNFQSFQKIFSSFCCCSVLCLLGSLPLPASWLPSRAELGSALARVILS
jgi:hypothetical protein